jgi:phytoene synthase
MSPDEYCQQKAAASGSSFYYAFLFLPPERRRAITALYAFCREVDDAVDEPTDPAVAHDRLRWWRTEVAALYAGRPQHPVTRALAPAVDRFDFPRELLEEIMDGMAMDLHQQRYATFDGLKLYCHRVAGVVGGLAARIFGYTNPKTLEYADRLGLAFQLTNIIRDVGEDARRNRIYLPTEDLATYEVPATDILAGRASDKFRSLMAFEVERAQRCYDEAFALLPPEDRRAQRPGLVMAGIYRKLLGEIGGDAAQVLSHRISLTPIRKLWIAWRTWVAA